MTDAHRRARAALCLHPQSASRPPGNRGFRTLSLTELCPCYFSQCSSRNPPSPQCLSIVTAGPALCIDGGRIDVVMETRASPFCSCLSKYDRFGAICGGGRISEDAYNHGSSVKEEEEGRGGIFWWLPGRLPDPPTPPQKHTPQINQHIFTLWN